MPRSETSTLLRNLHQRVTTIEQILPTLATKNDLKSLATKDDLKLFTTKVDLENELRRYATKEDLQNELRRFATKEELREEGERSRRYMKMLIEDVYEMVKRILDGQGRNTEWLEEHRARLDAHDAMIGGLDIRVLALEHGRQRR